jgi:U3 small nucleolar RNA-associated protein 4
MAASHSRTFLAVGGEDGGLRLFSPGEERGIIEYKRTFPRCPGRVLSVCWAADDKSLVTGSSEGMVRLLSVATGECQCRITLQTVGSVPSLVWACAILDDGSIATGDSKGCTQIWESKHGTLLQKFGDASRGDVTCLVAAGKQLWSGAVDGRVLVFKQSVSKKDVAQKWVLLHKHRLHSHDIRVLAASTAPGFPCVLSGGLDGGICVYTAATGLLKARISPYSQRAEISVAAKKRLLLYQARTSVEVWALAADNDAEPQARCIVQLRTKGEHNIRSSCISSDGQYVAVSDVMTTKIFQIHHSADVWAEQLAVLEWGSNKLCFSRDSSRLVCAQMDGSVLVLGRNRPKENGASAGFAEVHRFDLHRRGHSDGGHPQGQAVVTSLAISGDGQWLASGDTRNRIHVYNFDTLQYSGSLPVFDEPHTALSFHQTAGKLAVVLENRRVVVFDCDENRVDAWSRAYSSLIDESLGKSDDVLGVSFGPAAASTELLIFGSSFFWKISMDRPLLPTPPEPTPNAKDAAGEKGAKLVKKRKRAAVRSTELSGPVRKYQPILYAGLEEHGEVVLVERPWLHVLSALPAPLAVHRYGT